MKNRILTFAVMLAAIAVSASCIRNDVPKGEGKEATGTFRLSKIEFSEAVDILHKTRAGVPTDDFSVRIAGVGSGEEHLDCKYSEMPESLELPVGEYRIDVESHQVQDAEWSRPYYAATEFFEITKNHTTQLDALVCKLANIMVSTSFTDNSLEMIGDDAVASVRIGSAWLYYGLTQQRTDTPYNSINYRHYKDITGFFKANEEANTLYWEFAGKVEGEFLEDSGTVPNVKAGEHHKLTFDINRTPVPGEETGSVEFIFSVDVTVESYDLNLNVEITEEYIGELDRAVEFGSTHSFSQRSVLKATETMSGGEVAIPVNITLEAVKGLSSVIVELTTDSDALNGVLAAAGLNNAFNLAEPGALAGELAALGLPAGNAVAGQNLLTIDLKGLVKLAFDNGGANEFDIRITARDNDSNVSAKTLRLKLTDDSVPANIGIVWVGNDIAQRQTIVGSRDLEEVESEDMPVSKFPIVIAIAAPEGIASLVVEIISDNPFFGVDVLQDIGLDQRFDLVAPHDVGADTPMSEVLAALGFPVEDQVKDKSELQFDITSFVPLIYAVSSEEFDEVDFKLTVRDNGGNEASESIQLKIVKDI